MTRATSIATSLDEPLTVLSSRNRPAHSEVEWIVLPLDTDETTADSHDPTAGGIAHWAPTGVRGLTDRMATIAEWVARERPTLFVVDVSIEVALFVRLLGVDVAVMAMPGDRTDEPHQLAYRAATQIIAPWAQSFYDPPWLHPYAAKTSYVGAISRFDGRPRESTSTDSTVVVLGGAGGTALSTSDVGDAASANAQYRWVPAGVDDRSWVDDVWPTLCSATVVVTHAGQNAIADCACAGVPTIVIPQERPHGEQRATAKALETAGVAVLVDGWPDPGTWTSLLTRARALDSAAWGSVRQPGAAARAARILSSVAESRSAQ
ncbi:glycosyltransferase [Rhodococcus sovatensis]|uniref:Glycosyltransferase n=1 Tax=Rhodococcus sovatensis TaxID=1805840 RepID=A0ABZ2PCI8_9NOCA